MPNRNFPIFALLLALLIALGASPAQAGILTVQLSASRTALLADGKQTTDITAMVMDGGRPANNVEVQFQTTGGQLSETRVRAFGGVARVRLTSSPIAGIAKVTAFTTGGGSDVMELVFSDDPQATFEGNSYMAISASGYLAYSASDRIIEGTGKNAGAKIAYRNIELTADRLQLRCDDSVVRAQDNITLKHGKNVLHASRLYYSLQTGQGFAITDQDGKLRPVTVTGEHLLIAPSPYPIPSSYMSMPVPQVKLVIVARGITYFPNDRLQFRRPRFYQDQQQIMSLPYYELPLNSTELFSDQFVSVGTSGFGLELPFYYNLTPKSTGIIYLRHQERVGRGYYSTTPGFSVDVIQGYSGQGDHRFEGAYGFTGLTRGDWGFRWTHNQEFNPDTQANFYVDFPQHSGVYSSANYSQQNRAFRWGANLSGGQTFVGPSVNSLYSSAYAETQPRPLTRSMMYTVGTNLTTTRTAASGSANIHETTETISSRAFTHPIPLGHRTTLTNSFTVGHLWSSGGASGPLALASFSLDHTMRGGGALTLNYDFVMQPRTFDYSGGKHRLSMNYTVASSKRFQASLFGSMFLDSRDASLLADASYILNRQWRFLTSVTLQQFSGDSYSDLEFTLGRRMGARELQLTYSTFLKRISVDLTATRF